MNNLENKISEKYDNNSYLDINNGFVNMQVENIVGGFGILKLNDGSLAPESLITMVPELLEDLGYKSAKALYEVVMQARYNKSQLSDETKEILSMFISSQYIIKDGAISDSYVASIIRNTVYGEGVNGIK